MGRPVDGDELELFHGSTVRIQGLTILTNSAPQAPSGELNFTLKVVQILVVLVQRSKLLEQLERRVEFGYSLPAATHQPKGGGLIDEDAHEQDVRIESLVGVEIEPAEEGLRFSIYCDRLVEAARQPQEVSGFQVGLSDGDLEVGGIEPEFEDMIGIAMH